MKRIVVDTNIIFASLRSKDSYLREKLLDSQVQYYSPNFVIAEIFKHKERLLSKAKASEEEIYEFLNKILQVVHFVNENFISFENAIYAYKLCKDIDEKDSPFVALTIELNGELWTRDLELINGLTSKGFSDFYKETL